jgi:DSF synthase
MWLYWLPRPRPCFNVPLLDACSKFSEFMANTSGVVQHQGQTYPIQSCVIASDVPDVFNLGGDLNLFSALIQKQDRGALLKYGMACVDAVYNNYTGYTLPITTISLVQGQCLGGGFEAALSSNVVVAERSAKFGFPEIIFNLFPGMGAMSFLMRRCSDKKFPDVMTSSGELYSAEVMKEKGVIDILVDDGEGPAAVSHYLRMLEPKHRHNFKVHKIIGAVKRRELDEIVTMWVDTALRIDLRNLRMMDALVARQSRLRK